MISANLCGAEEPVKVPTIKQSAITVKNFCLRHKGKLLLGSIVIGGFWKFCKWQKKNSDYWDNILDKHAIDPDQFTSEEKCALAHAVSFARIYGINIKKLFDNNPARAESISLMLDEIAQVSLFGRNISRD